MKHIKGLFLTTAGYMMIPFTLLLFLYCSDGNVKQIQDNPTNKVFAIDIGDGDTTYLRQVIVDNSTIYLICNKQGKTLAGTSSHTGKFSTSVLMPDTVRDTVRDTMPDTVRDTVRDTVTK
jgi:hypothetical protein